MIDASQFARYRQLSVAITEALHATLAAHFDKEPGQEDLAFALWRPSAGRTRYSAIVEQVVLPDAGDRDLHGNVAFHPQYLRRVLQLAGQEYGIALVHSHLGPGWQGMSDDDVIAERDRLASAVAGITNLPLLGLTWGTDGAWSGRFWLRRAPRSYERYWATTVRVVGRQLRITYHPQLLPPTKAAASQVATVSVWGEQCQADLARTHVGVIGLGSVGSIVNEALSRIGISRVTLIDHDHIEDRNLDRTLGAVPEDVIEKRAKVAVAERLMRATHTVASVEIDAYQGSVLHPDGLARALDCDVVFSCVDRPWPRHLLNALAYAHLIPVIDGGILAKVERGRLVHADWRIHTIGPGRACMVCLGALRHDAIALDRAGLLDDPEYIQGLGPEFSLLLTRQNVFPFSLSVAAHEVLQLVGLISGNQRIGGIGPQTYHCHPGCMTAVPEQTCESGCSYDALTASAADLTGNLAVE